MTCNTNCIFCKIIQGEIPSAKVYEDEHVLAFMDISQTTKGHTLVIPKQHFENIYELPQEVAANLFSVVPKIANAIKNELQPIGLNLVNNNEKPAGQAVFHYHLHLVPRYGEENEFKIGWNDHSDQYEFHDLEAMAQKIKEGIS